MRTGVIAIIVPSITQVVCIDISRGFNTVNAKLSAAAGLSDKIIIPGERYGSIFAKEKEGGGGGFLFFRVPCLPCGRNYDNSTTSSPSKHPSSSLLFLSPLSYLLPLSPSMCSVPCYPGRRNRMTSSLPSWYAYSSMRSMVNTPQHPRP